MDVTEASLEAGIDQMVAGNRLSDIGHAVQVVAEAAGFSVVRAYEGHAIGTAMHEKPGVPTSASPGKGPKLKEGMVFAIEPMVNAGGAGTRVLRGRLERRHRGRLAFPPISRHSVAITDNGPEVLHLPLSPFPRPTMPGRSWRVGTIRQ